MAAFNEYKHGILTYSGSATGNAGIAIEANWHTIADLFDDVTSSGSSLYYRNGNDLTGPDGQLYYGYSNGVTLTDCVGNLHYANGNFLTFAYNLCYPNGGTLADTTGLRYSNGNILADPTGVLYYGYMASVTLADSVGRILYSNGHVLADAMTLYYPNGSSLADSSGMHLLDGGTLSFGTSTGGKLGSSANELIAFHGAAPAAQRAGAEQVAVDTTEPTNSSPYGFTSDQAVAILTLLNEIRTTLVEKGLMKGSA